MNTDGKILKISCQLNSRTHKNDHSPRASRVHPIDAGMGQYTEIHQYNLLHNQTQRKNPHIMPLDAEKPFDKIQHPFMLKVLEKSRMQGPYLNMVKAIYSKPVANIKITGE